MTEPERVVQADATMKFHCNASIVQLPYCEDDEHTVCCYYPLPLFPRLPKVAMMSLPNFDLVRLAKTLRAHARAA